MTALSVSTVRMRIWWWPCCAACDTCSSVRLSASSWLHRASVRTSCNSCVLGIPFPSVRTTFLSSLQNARRRTLDGKLNSYVLLLSALRKFCQFPGTASSPNTRILTPFPRLALLCLSGNHPCKNPKRGPHVTHCAAEKKYMG